MTDEQFAAFDAIGRALQMQPSGSIRAAGVAIHKARSDFRNGQEIRWLIAKATAA